MEYVINEYETRYFAGIELIGGLKVDSDDYKRIPGLWDDFRELYLDGIPNKNLDNNFIGLEMYRFDFMESKTMDYFALVEIKELFDCNDEEVVTKKLSKGRYISFSIEHDDHEMLFVGKAQLAQHQLSSILWTIHYTLKFHAGFSKTPS